MIIIEKIVIALIAIAFGVITILSEQRVERTRSSGSTTAMVLGMLAYVSSMIALFE